MKIKQLMDILKTMNPESEVFTFIGSAIGYKICPIITVGRDEEKGNDCNFVLLNTEFDGQDWTEWAKDCDSIAFS